MDMKYKVILTDPPWCYSQQGRKGCIQSRGGRTKYTTMSEEELGALRYPASKESVMFCWITAPNIPMCISVLRANGFEYRGVHIVWVKMTDDGLAPKCGVGSYSLCNVELLVMGTRGERCGRLVPAGRWVEAPRPKGFSVKPAFVFDEVLAFAEKHSLGRPLECFARCTSDARFDYWLGDQQVEYAGMTRDEVSAATSRVFVPIPAPREKRRKLERDVLVAADLSPVRDVVLNQDEEYAALLVTGGSAFHASRLDVGAGVHDDGVLVVEASCESLEDIVSVISARGFEYKTVMYFMHAEAPPGVGQKRESTFYLCFMKKGGRIGLFRRKRVKQPCKYLPALQSCTDVAVQMMRQTFGLDARVAVLAFGPTAYTLQEFN